MGRSQPLSPLSADEKGVEPIYSLGGTQPTSIVSESGLYKLILRSDKPQAKRFQDWLARDVPPAIRKDGGYVMGGEVATGGEPSGGLPMRS